jgi:hypothetical protein
MFGNKNSVADETTNAIIMDAQQTNMYVNQLPLVKMVIGIFPDNGPLEIVECKRALNFVEIPQLVSGTSVSVTFERDKKGAVKEITGIKLNHIEWEGDPEVIDSLKALIDRITDCKLIQAEGELLSIEETKAKISGVPIFKYNVQIQHEGRADNRGGHLSGSASLAPAIQNRTYYGNDTLQRCEKY